MMNETNNIKTIDDITLPTNKKKLFLYFVLAVGCFNFAFYFPDASFLIILYLYFLIGLSRTEKRINAFLLGFGVGLCTIGLQLGFFYQIFGPFAIALYSLLSIYIGFFVVICYGLFRVFNKKMALCLIPFIWLGLEYFRSEMYYLEFAWLTVSHVFSDNPSAVFINYLGYYGIGFALTVVCAFVYYFKLKIRLIILCVFLIIFSVNFSYPRSEKTEQEGPYIVGIQFEFAPNITVMKNLNKVLKEHPDCDIIVLSECAFDVIPQDVYDWCKVNQKYLVAGAKDVIGQNKRIDYYNTAFVIGPDGEVVFKQAKSKPVQFFNDGIPAKTQDVWSSPWGPIGLAICYDLSYTQIIDVLIEKGARMLIIPTMDVENWGEYEHELHAKIAPLRAKEYNVPIVRVCSSGISQFVLPNGQVIAKGAFPGQGDIISSRMKMSKNPSIPFDRFPALLSSIFVLFITLLMLFLNVKNKDRLKNSTKNNVNISN